VNPERRRPTQDPRAPQGTTPVARIESLGLLRRACWLELERAAQERDHGWRTLALATVDADRADARVVILREVDAAAQCLRFYTDARSRKVAQIGQQPLGTLLAWCPRLSWQLRLQVRLRIDTEERSVQPRWARLRMTPAAQDYMSPLAPGLPLVAAEREPDGGPRTNFAVVHAEVLGVDWLELHADGPRRARFDAQGEIWIQP
jgi:hypothetical protein